MQKKISALVLSILLFSLVVPVFAQTGESGSTLETTEEISTEEVSTEEAATEEATTEEAAAGESGVFPDVPADYEDYAPINYLQSQGVLKGYPDGTFKPLVIVNRAELMKIMVVGQGIEPPAETYKNCFPDVADEWFAPYVCYAKEQGWVAGYPDGKFQPGKPVNRAEAAKMILNALGVQLTVDAPLYNDVPGTEWYARYARTIRFKRLAKWDVFNGPLGMTRVEVAIMLYRILVITEQDVETFYDNLEAKFDSTMPLDIIALQNRFVEDTKERLEQATTLFNEGVAAGKADDYEGSLSKFNSALVLAPRFAAVWAGKAFSHYMLEQYERARFSINTALILNPLKPVFYAIKGVVLYHLDMPKRSIEHLEIAAQMREKAELALDPLPALDTWSSTTLEELVPLAENAVETWSWQTQLTAEQWADKYIIDESAEREGTDSAS